MHHNDYDDAWMVRWILKDGPTEVPWDMFITAPVRVFTHIADEPVDGRALTCHQPEGCYTLRRVADKLEGRTVVAWEADLNLDENFVDGKREPALAFLKSLRAWILRWNRMGRPAAMPRTMLAIAPNLVFDEHKTVWATDDDCIAEKVLVRGKIWYRIIAGNHDPVRYDNWDTARMVLQRRIGRP